MAEKGDFFGHPASLAWSGMAGSPVHLSMDDIKDFNKKNPDQKKHVLLICHSFQVFCRYYGYGTVSKRKSTSFGVMPVHKTFEGHHDPLFRSLNDPMWAVDSRDYQITAADVEKIDREADAVRDDLDQIAKLAKDAGEDAEDIKDMVKEEEVIRSSATPSS